MPEQQPSAELRAMIVDGARQIASPRRLMLSMEYTGHCHWCGAITGGGRRFCDADCRDAWKRRRAQHSHA